MIPASGQPRVPPVVCHAILDDRCQWTGNCRHYREETLIERASRLLISEIRDAYYLTGCTPDWKPLCETRHLTLGEAKDQAEYEFRGVGACWVPGPPPSPSGDESRPPRFHVSRGLYRNALFRMNQYRDSDLVFHLEVCEGYHEITAWCLERLRSCYPGARIIVVSDGTPDPRYREYLRHQVELIYGDHLYIPGRTGQLWLRRFRGFLERPAKYFFRADSDVGFYRRFLSLPESSCVFGTPCSDFIQGGFMGFSFDAVRRILDSGLLTQPWMERFTHLVRGAPMPSDDRAIGEVARRLGIPLVDHPEIQCSWQLRHSNQDFRYAVVHPCKNAKL